MEIKWKSSGGGRLFVPKYPGDAGFDLEVTQVTRVEPGKMAKVPCGISIALPEGYSAIMVARSSAVMQGLLVAPTLIDSGYRGELFVFCYSLGDTHALIPVGTRIAQLLPISMSGEAYSVLQVEELPTSHRGSNGFGSSGGKL